MSNVGQGANKPYPQEVTLDAARAEAAKMQSDASKAHGGTIPKNDPASAARSAASQSQHVVNILTSGDPVNAGHVSAAAKNEAGADGQVPKDGAAATVQSAVTKLKEVKDDKVQNRSGITQEDASKIAAAEATLHDGQVPTNSVSSKAQAAADKAKQAGLIPEA